VKQYAFLLVLILFASLILSAFSISIVMAAEDSWETMADMPTARSKLGVAVVDGKIYAIGGYLDQISFSGHLGTNEMYDPATNTWATKESMPTARDRFGIAVVQNKIYVIGGETDDGYTGANEVYDPLTDTWETRTSMPTVRADLSANVVDEKIYLISGTETYGYGAWPRGINVTEVYDPATDSCTATSMPTPRLSLGVAVVDDILYAIGGGFYAELGFTESNKNEKYTPSGYIPEFPSWTPLLILLIGVLVVTVIYKQKLHKQKPEES